MRRIVGDLELNMVEAMATEWEISPTRREDRCRVLAVDSTHP